MENPKFIRELSARYGSQAVIGSIDAKKSIWGGYHVRTHGGQKNSGRHPLNWAKELESLGAGEILLTSIDQEGTWEGFDLDLVKSVTSAVNVPVIAHGGAGKVDHIGAVIKQAGASAVALGSMVVFQKKEMGVLVNFPNETQLKAALA